jgi:hypothetical protein
MNSQQQPSDFTDASRAAMYNSPKAEQKLEIVNPFEADGGIQAIQQLFAERNTKESNYKKILGLYGAKLTSTYDWYRRYVKYSDDPARECLRNSLFALSSAYSMLTCFRDIMPIQSEEGGMTDYDLNFLIEKTKNILDYCSQI